MNPRWLLRAKRLAQNPPSMTQVKLALAIAGFCALLYGIEVVWGWPDALTPDRVRPLR